MKYNSRFSEWVENKSINGPSEEVLENTDKNKFVLLFKEADADLWYIANTESTIKELSNYTGHYYLVFRSELNNFLRRD